MSEGKYNNLKDLVSDYVSGFGISFERLKKKIEDAYQNDEISAHEYDDLMQYLDD